MTGRQRERRHRRAGAAVVAAGLLAGAGLGAAGCSGGDAVAGDSRGGDPVVTLRKAADRLVGAGSSRARTSMEMATGGTRVTIRGAGVYDYRKRLGRLKVLLPQDPAGAGEHRPITELLAPGALFMKNRGAGVPADKWVRVDTRHAVRREPRHRRGHRSVRRGRGAARDADGDVRGQDGGGGRGQVRHYRGTADLGDAARRATDGEQGPP